MKEVISEVLAVMKGNKMRIALSGIAVASYSSCSSVQAADLSTE